MAYWSDILSAHSSAGLFTVKVLRYILLVYRLSINAQSMPTLQLEY